MNLNPAGPLTRAVDSEALPAAPIGLVMMGRQATSLEAAPIPLNNGGSALVVTTTSATAFIPTVAKIEAASSGNNTLISAPGASTRLLIWHFNFFTRSAVNVRLLSAATQLSGLYNFSGPTGFAFDGSIAGGPLVCGTNEAFIANLSAAIGIDGFVLYTTGAV